MSERRSRVKRSRRSQITLDVSWNEAERLEKAAAIHGFASASDYLLWLHRKTCESPVASRGEEREAAKRPCRRLSTERGSIFEGDSLGVMRDVATGAVNLILTSPPFGLVFKKGYGNEDADRYVEWFRPFAREFRRILAPNGSLVIDIGGAWKKGQPTRSLYHYELLISLAREFGFHLAQEFYWWNPARLPSPAEWVNVRRVRVKDAVNCIWWLSLSPYPKASNRRVLQPYSRSMRNLLERGYRPGIRPSGHRITDKFSRDNGGAIPPNLLAVANTESQSSYQRYCRERGLVEHPARFPAPVPAFFVQMLTDPDDLVLDPFAGSCVTGAVAERMGRRWMCCEIEGDYVEGAKGRFRTGNDLRIDAFSDRPYEIAAPRISLTQQSPLDPAGGSGVGSPPRRGSTKPRRRGAL